MAREAGFETMRWHGLLPHVPKDIFIANVRVTEEVKRLVALVRADEREACAKVCENNSASYSERASRPEKVRDISPEVARIAVQTCGHVAAAIRARGNT
jgi:hypothetical protein